MPRRRKNQGASTPRPSAAVELAALLSKTTGMKFTANASDTPVFGKDRAVSVKIVSPSSVYQGRVSNPDPVLMKHSWDGICLYDRMERQFPTYAGVCNLWADKVCANDLAIKPGDPDSGRSREMADLTRTQYRRLADKHIINKKAAKGRFFGFAATGKADWRRDPATGLNVPHDLYDIPQRYIDFKEDGTALAKTERSLQGIPIDPDAVMFFRWGSRFTPWGEPDAQFCYLPLWYVQQCRQFGMQGLEILSRPIPWVEIPDTVVGEDYDTLEAGLKAQYKYYVITRTSSNRTTVTFPSSNILANGAAGRSEMEYVRYFYGEVYIYILGVQMTQDKTGGSRALEDTRISVVEDKTPPGVQALAQMWQKGYSNHIWRVNAPNEPQQLYPVWEPQTAMSGASLDGFRLQQVVEVLTRYELKQLTDVAAMRLITAAGLPEEWASEVITSTRENLHELTPPQPKGTEPEPRLPEEGDTPDETQEAA